MKVKEFKIEKEMSIALIFKIYALKIEKVFYLQRIKIIKNL
jgi:hypothetical protein